MIWVVAGIAAVGVAIALWWAALVIGREQRCPDCGCFKGKVHKPKCTWLLDHPGC